MKTITILKRAFIFSGLFIQSMFHAQLSPQDILSHRELVWYGLDFTEARFIGLFDQISGCDPANESEIVHKYIPAWNALVISEPHNFNLLGTFRKTELYNDVNVVQSRNAAIKPNGILSLSSYSLSKDRLATIISSYPEGERKEGLGLVFIVESFDKGAKKGSYWLVFFDIKTRKILFTDYCFGAPNGFGLRNYWSGSFKHVLKDIREYKYDLWKRILTKNKSL